MLEIDEALTKFAAEEPAAAELVKLRHFVGLSIDEVAEALGVSRATANRHWAYAKAWFRFELDPKGEPRVTRGSDPVPGQH